MKFDFTYYNPTKIYFGKKSLNNLGEELKIMESSPFGLREKFY